MAAARRNLMSLILACSVSLSSSSEYMTNCNSDIFLLTTKGVCRRISRSIFPKAAVESRNSALCRIFTVNKRETRGHGFYSDRMRFPKLVCPHKKSAPIALKMTKNGVSTHFHQSYESLIISRMINIHELFLAFGGLWTDGCRLAEHDHSGNHYDDGLAVLIGNSRGQQRDGNSSESGPFAGDHHEQCPCYQDQTQRSRHVGQRDRPVHMAVWDRHSDDSG